MQRWPWPLVSGRGARVEEGPRKPARVPNVRLQSLVLEARAIRQEALGRQVQLLCKEAAVFGYPTHTRALSGDNNEPAIARYNRSGEARAEDEA